MITYYKDGVRFKKLDRDEVIRADAMQSWDNGELQPIMNTDGETVGSTPSLFSDERDFYNPLTPDMIPDIDGYIPFDEALGELLRLSALLKKTDSLGMIFDKRIESIEAIFSLIKQYNEKVK